MTPPLPAARRALVSALTAAVAAAALAAAPAPATAAGPPPREARPAAAVPEFYDPPAELPPGNGTLIRSEPLPLGVRLPGPGGTTLPGTATRLMYTSTDANGQPVAVTGAYLEPAAPWPHDGPRPLVALAPGTMGQGDQCAASLALEHPLAVDLGEGTVSVGYENIAVYRLLARGIAVVITDYPGLGTTDRVHTYVNRADEAHALLDAARAAHAVAGTSLTPGSPVGLYGYSQGGGASAAAAELQPSYAPELPLVGAYAGAPPADLTQVMTGIDGSALAAAIGWTVNGMIESRPGLGPLVDGYLSDAGREALAEVSGMCVGDAILGYAFTESTRWTADGRSVADIVAAEPEVRAFLGEQRIGRTAPAAPVRVATGVADDIVPHGQARQLAADWCERGASVTYVPVRLPDLGDGLLTNHLVPLVADQGHAISWLADRLAGEPAGSTCGSLPGQP
ncbi:lipase family protein [Streptomyces sp. 7-21]|uniref:lipase family protein n=1 Tax=Streptomyces sp. 7-21 TaxID=2802283 RepID=UPI00191D3010|nr:lipase family protein [Streptomyces sp. 7-21]MBL1068060.1 alpha/beta fold hydrolase [Streptomyces sp. 7-21]